MPSPQEVRLDTTSRPDRCTDLVQAVHSLLAAAEPTGFRVGPRKAGDR
jgi:hypothetical protein